MPVPQEINFIVEQASCLFLTMVQDMNYLTDLGWHAGEEKPGFCRKCFASKLQICSNRVSFLDFRLEDKSQISNLKLMGKGGKVC